MVATEAKTVAEELEIIRKKNKGVLRPDDVVEFARDKDSALHDRFEWDDGEAAQQYRLYQARNIIRVCVYVEEGIGGRGLEVRTYVALTPDRGKNSYRAVVDVLRSPKRREQMLADALRDLKSLRHKYRTLTELSDVFAAIDEVAK